MDSIPRQATSLGKGFGPGRGVYGGNRLMFLSDINVSLYPSLPLSLKSTNISLGEDLRGGKPIINL